MKSFCFSVPLGRIVTIENVDVEFVNTDLNYVFKLVRMANEQGIQNRMITEMSVEPSNDRQRCVFNFKYKDVKENKNDKR